MRTAEPAVGRSQHGVDVLKIEDCGVFEYSPIVLDNSDMFFMEKAGKHYIKTLFLTVNIKLKTI
jgi:hypothetical protein